MKKIVAIDLDGTLLHSDCTISSYSKEVIAEAVKNGIMVVPTSGRSFRSIKNQVQDIEGVKYCICANGTLVGIFRQRNCFIIARYHRIWFMTFIKK